MIRTIAFVSSLLIASVAIAEGDARGARETAHVAQKGTWSVGLFNPLRYAITDDWELEAHPVFFFVAPHIAARGALLRKGSLFLTTEVGLSVPTPGLNLTKGYFFPSWDVTKKELPWTAVVRGGFVLSGGLPDADVWTVRLEGASGIPFGDMPVGPPDTFLAPLNLLFAPALGGMRGRLGGAWDHALTPWIRGRASLDGYLMLSPTEFKGDEPGNTTGNVALLEPFVLTAHAGVDFLFGFGRITVGCLYANSDQGATALTVDGAGISTRERVRSHDFLPTFDVIFEGW